MCCCDSKGKLRNDYHVLEQDIFVWNFMSLGIVRFKWHLGGFLQFVLSTGALLTKTVYLTSQAPFVANSLRF